MSNTKQTAGETAPQTTHATDTQLKAAWNGGPKVTRHYFTLDGDTTRDLDALTHRLGYTSRSRMLERIIKNEYHIRLSVSLKFDTVGEPWAFPKQDIATYGTVGGKLVKCLRLQGMERRMDADALMAALITEARGKQQKADAKAFMKKAVA